MKGLLFNVVEAVVTDVAGADAWDDVLDAAGVAGVYTSLGDYDDAELHALLVAAAARLHLTVDALLVTGGRLGFRHLAAHAPDLVAPYRDVAGLLQDLDDVIHPEVRKLYPHAAPPRFVTMPIEHGFELEYRSERGLCRLVEGLALGAADRFEQVLTVEHLTCVRHGDAVCRLRLVTSPRVPA